MYKIDTFGHEFDLIYQYRWNDLVSFYANYSNLQPGKGLTGGHLPNGDSAPNDSVSRFFGGVRIVID